jgi:hypothetical protein
LASLALLKGAEILAVVCLELRLRKFPRPDRVPDMSMQVVKSEPNP